MLLWACATQQHVGNACLSARHLRGIKPLGTECANVRHQTPWGDLPPATARLCPAAPAPHQILVASCIYGAGRSTLQQEAGLRWSSMALHAVPASKLTPHGRRVTQPAGTKGQTAGMRQHQTCCRRWARCSWARDWSMSTTCSTPPRPLTRRLRTSKPAPPRTATLRNLATQSSKRSRRFSAIAPCRWQC